MAEEQEKDGRFATGEPSRNKRGRPRKKTGPLVTVSDLNNVIMKVANQKVPQKHASDGLPPINLFERNVRSLASGNPQNRLASRSFVDIVRTAAYDEEHRARRNSGGRS
jgi:hypothetical protein